MAVEVSGREEWRRNVLHQRLLVRFGPNPENDDVLIAFPGFGIDRIWARIAEEDKRLPAHLVDRIATGPVVNGDMWHSPSKFVHVIDRGLPTFVVLHSASVGRAPRRVAFGFAGWFVCGALISLGTGIRTERHVPCPGPRLTSATRTRPSRPASVAVWRSAGRHTAAVSGRLCVLVWLGEGDLEGPLVGTSHHL